jgi:hypothetical protein
MNARRLATHGHVPDAVRSLWGFQLYSVTAISLAETHLAMGGAILVRR